MIYRTFNTKRSGNSNFLFTISFSYLRENNAESVKGRGKLLKIPGHRCRDTLKQQWLQITNKAEPLPTSRHLMVVGRSIEVPNK